MDGRATGIYPRSAESGSEVGPYRLLRRLGKGGMAEVFLAVHRHLGHVRAVKVLWPDQDEARAALAKRLLTEARATARLRHPAIVEVFECDTLPGGGAFIAMEYLQGEAAGTWLERVGALATHPMLAAALIGVVADALGHAHAQGIIHRDIKPDNLVLIPDETDRQKFRVKVLDFGIAKMLNEQPLVVTRADRAIGTPYYMAPEQWFGNGIVDARTDVYALGCLFFEVLTGRPPFDHENGVAMMHAHIQEPPPPVRSLAPETPEPLAALVTQMLAKSPDDRPQTMIEVVTALEAYLERYRHGFDELLLAPAGFPVAVGSGSQTEPTSLGVGSGVDPGHPSQTTAPLTADSRRAKRGAAVAALAIVGLVAFLAAGSLVTRNRSESATAKVPAAAPPPALTPPAPVSPVPAPVVPAPAPARAEELPPAIVVPAPPTTVIPAARSPERRPPARPQRPRNVYRPVGD